MLDEELTLPQPEGPPGAIGASGGEFGEVVGPETGLSAGGQIGPPSAAGRAAEPIQPRSFGEAGMSVEEPGAYQGGAPVGGPSSLFNIGGAPISILGGVFGGGLPIGGPVTQIFRSGAPEPNTLFISTLQPSGPIGTFLLGGGGSPVGGVGQGGIPFGIGPFEGGNPIGGVPATMGQFGNIPTGGQPVGGSA